MMQRISVKTLSSVCLCLILAACGSDNASTSSSDTDTGTTPPSGSDPDTQTQAPITKLAVLDVAGVTERVSTDSAGMQGDQNSINSSISADGQIVVFDSTSTNLVANDSNAVFDIFAKNRRDNSTQRLSVATDGSQADGSSVDPKVTTDGRYVVFSSDATNLVADDLNAMSDIFLHDIVTGITTLISKNNNNEPGNGHSEMPNISADGRFIVFVSESTNFSSIDNNTVRDVYLHDRNTATTSLVSSNALGDLGNGESMGADISADGNHVVFSSIASNLVNGDSNNNMDVFLKNMSNNSVIRISTDSTGVESNGLSDTPSISSNGNVVAYRSTATNLVANVTTISKQIYVKDIVTGINELISVNDQGEISNAGSFFSIGISADGQIVAFYTEGDNLASLDTNLTWDVFIRDRQRQITRLISVNSAGQVGDGNSFLPSINEQGNYVSFGSSATNLSVDDTNASWDIFVHILAPMNMPPIAIAGVDQQVSVGSVVQLDASQSYDPDATANGSGPVTGYLWQVVSAPLGSTAGLSNTTSVSPTFTPDMDGVYVIGLIVNDGTFDSVQATMTITVTPNLAPTANIAINTTSGPQPLTVQVDASGSSDPEGDALTYSWDFADPQSGSANTSTMVTATHSYQSAGTYSIILTVTDSFGNQSQVFTTVEVLAVNRAPEILSMASVYTGPAPLTIQFKANASDPDGDTLSYLWSFADGSSDSVSTIADPIHTFSTPGTYIVSIDVSDGELVTRQLMTVIVESGLLFNIDEAVIEYEHDEIVNAKISFEASITMSDQSSLDLSASDDFQITVQVDDMTLLNVPLSAFSVEIDANGNEEFVYRDNYLKVEIEPSENEFEFRAERLLLGNQVDNANGIDFVVNIGAYSAIDNVVMQNLPLPDCYTDESQESSNELYCQEGSPGQQILIYRSNTGS